MQLSWLLLELCNLVVITGQKVKLYLDEEG